MNPSAGHSNAARSWRLGSGIALAVVVACGALTLYPSAGPASAAFPGSNGKIAFDRYLSGSGPSERKAVYVMKPDGSGLRRLTIGSEPNWSADGKKVVFSRRSKGGIQSIYVMNANGENVRRLTQKVSTMDRMPVWSPDGKEIAFVRLSWPEKEQPPGPADIYTMNANGENVRRLTKTPHHEDVPDWSPDGKRIAYAALIGSSTTARIFSVKPNGKGRQLLTTSGDEPDWSPDGKQIAFDRGEQIFVMTARGDQAHLVGPGAGLAGNNAAWSPDGTQIAFVGFHPPGGTAEGFIGIFTMNVDGTKIVQLTVGGKVGDFGVNDSFPDWQPR